MKAFRKLESVSCVWTVSCFYTNEHLVEVLTRRWELDENTNQLLNKADLCGCKLSDRSSCISTNNA